MADYLCGLDLGQSGDYTALAIMRRSMSLFESGLPRRSLKGDMLFKFECVHLERYKLGTSYPTIVASVKEIVGRPQLGGNPRLVVDATGVGRAVVDMFLNERMGCPLFPLTITAGDTVRVDSWNPGSGVRGYWVPKNELVSSVRANLESGRLRIAPKLHHAETLKKELLDFRVKVTAAANETFNAREGAHDDMVLAVAMAVWLGEQRKVEYVMADDVPVGPKTREQAHLIEEARIEKNAVDQEAEEQRIREEREWRNPSASHWWPNSEFD